MATETKKDHSKRNERRREARKKAKQGRPKAGARRSMQSADVVVDPKPVRPRKPAKPKVRKQDGPGGPVEVDALSQAVLASFVPEMCGVFGVPQDNLVGRVPAEDNLGLATGSLRKLVLGAIATLGRDLGLPWSGLCGDGAPDAIAGVHRTSLSQFAGQFGAWSGVNVDGLGTAGVPAGELGRFARDRFLAIKREALEEAGRRRGVAA